MRVPKTILKKGDGSAEVSRFLCPLHGKQIASPQAITQGCSRNCPKIGAATLRLDRFSRVKHPGFIFMARATLSFAQSLRAIGQALEVLHIHAFKLEKKAETYVVYNWEPSFLQGVAERVWGDCEISQEPLTYRRRNTPLVYSTSDTHRLEAQGHLRRGSKNIADDPKISLGLRALGEYLDKKNAVAFVISWSRRAVSVEYETRAHGFEQENFTFKNLRHLRLGMYLRRSGRQGTKN